MKKWNLIELEDKALRCYDELKVNPSSETRSNFFLAIEKLAFAILNILYRKQLIDYDLREIAYEYALYLFERIITNKFELNPKKNERFPLQYYISKNIKHVINDYISMMNNGNLKEIFVELETVINSTHICRDFGRDYIKTLYAQKLLDALSMFYSRENLARCLPYVIQMLYEKPHYYIAESYPAELRDMGITLIALAKRIVPHNIGKFINFDNKTLKERLEIALKSTIFLSTIANAKLFPKELLLVCDFDSLYRLVSCFGGNKIRIPTLRELDTLIGTANTIACMILENKEMNLSKTKTNYDLCFARHINMNNFIEKALLSYELDSKKTSTSLMNVLVKGIETLSRYIEKIDITKVNSSVLLQQYLELSNTFSKILETVINGYDNNNTEKLKQATVQ